MGRVGLGWKKNVVGEGRKEGHVLQGIRPMVLGPEVLSSQNSMCAHRHALNHPKSEA